MDFILHKSAYLTKKEIIFSRLKFFFNGFYIISIVKKATSTF